MEILVKETVTLHKVLSRYLSIPVVEVRFFPYFPPAYYLHMFGVLRRGRSLFSTL